MPQGKTELLSGSEMEEVFRRFKAERPNPLPELHAPNAYCLLVSVVLSAQATDKSVNKATEPLYREVQEPAQMLALGKDGLVRYIRSIGLYNSKAEHILALSKKLLDDFGGAVPATREELMSLPGVGRKTANVVLNVVYRQPVMPVDTHLLRICPKIGLAAGHTPQEVELSLMERVPQAYLLDAHHWLLLHGRYVCTARKPACQSCIISDICRHNGAQ